MVLGPRVAALVAALAVGAVVFATPVHADTLVVVAPGETLFQIALRHGTTVEELVVANGLSSADYIYAGQRLTIPDAGGVPGGSGGGQPAGTSYTVQPGDNLYGIAARFGTSVWALVRANDLRSADFIYVGQRLVIPGRSGVDTSPPPQTAPGPASGRKVVVDLSAQRVHAVENGETIASFVVSTGKSSTPTPLGTYRIYARYRSRRMAGADYDLPNVPHVQFFHKGYSLHGTYWHSSFGTPVSHGCVNMRQEDASWLWSWTAIGTPVVVQW